MTFPQIDKFDEGIEKSKRFWSLKLSKHPLVLFFINSQHQSSSSAQHGIEPQLVVSTLQSQIS